MANLQTIEDKLKAKAKRQCNDKAGRILSELTIWLNGASGDYCSNLFTRQGDNPDNYKYNQVTISFAKEAIKSAIVKTILPRAEQEAINDFYNKVMKGDDDA